MSANAIATVIIPVAPHHLPLLPRALDSVRQQTIPVDVIHSVDNHRRGPGYMRNRLAEQVKTPFLIMLDADDWLLPHFTETLLRHYQRGSYVYSDWYQGPHHVKATDCYAFTQSSAPDQRGWHLPPCLFPTALYHAIGGHDETLWGAEDTDFFIKANYHRIRSIRVTQPLFHYTEDGTRSKDASSRGEKWGELLRSIWMRYAKGLSMACCGGGNNVVELQAQSGSSDVLVRVLWDANITLRGRATGRHYGRVGHRQLLRIDPRDLALMANKFERVPDVNELSPDVQTAETALKDALEAQAGSSASLADRIRAAGVRNTETKERVGYDMQQHPEELAALLEFCLANGVRTVLEIGTGVSAGLARFMVKDLGWSVTSIDVNVPEATDLFDNPNWLFIQGDSAVEPTPLEPVDLLIIDGDHSYEAARRDYEKFSEHARIIAVHDISPTGYFPDGVAKFWRDLAYTKTGNLRKGFHEALVDGSKWGWGWHVRA